MSFNKAKLIRFNEGVSCSPPPGTYNPSPVESKVYSKNTGVKRMDSKPAEMLNTPPKLRCTRTFSLPVFRTPSVKRQIKLVTRSQSLVVDKDKEENIFNIPASNSATSFEGRADLISRSLSNNSLEDELNIASGEIENLKYKLMICCSSKENLKKELEDKNKNIHNLKLEQKIIKDLTEKLGIEIGKKESYTDEVVSRIEDLKLSLEKVVLEKDDLETILVEMKSAFIIINENYLSLEKEFNKIKQEKDLKIKEINKLKLKTKTECSACFNRNDTTASNLELMVNEIRPFFKHMEDEFHFLKTQSNKDFESATNHIHDCLQSELKNMEDQVLKGLCQLNDYFITTNNAITEFYEDTNRLVEQCSNVFDLLTESEIEKENLQVDFSSSKSLLIEIQNENQELQSSLKATKTRLRNHEITLQGLHDTIKAISRRLIDSDKEVERLNNVISDNERTLSEKNRTDSSSVAQATHNETIRNADLLSQYNELMEMFTKTGDNLSCTQMENHSLKLQLDEARENLLRLETQNSQKDVKLNEIKGKLNEQEEILEQQMHKISSLHIMLQHQHEEMVRSYGLQTIISDEERVIALEENLANKDQEILQLKNAYEEQLACYHKKSIQDSVRLNDCDLLRTNIKELKGRIGNLEQNLEILENSLKIEKQRNAALESEITSLKKTNMLIKQEKENVHRKLFKKENEKGSPRRKFSRSKSNRSNQSPILKERNK